MKLESKFDVNNLIIHKFSKNEISKTKNDSVCCFEVMEVVTQTCYGGTQIFYDCRPIHGITETNFDEGKKITKIVDFLSGHFNGNKEYCRFREDEIVACSQEIIDLVLGGK